MWLMIVAFMAGMLVASMFCAHILNQTLDFQQNVIGVLYQIDESNAETYIQAMFEPLSQENLDKGQTALVQHGYTEKGIQFLGENMGLWKSGGIGFGLLFLIGGVVLVCFYQMRKMHRLEVEALQQEISALQQNKMKDEYIANQNQRIQSFIENITHQMKTPLSRVVSSLDIVEEEVTDNVSKQHIEECYQHLDSINVLLKRLMDIGRMEAGKVIFQKEKVDLGELFEEVRNGYARDRSRVNIHCEKDKMEYYGDEKWLKEAFTNIICNALEADKSENPVEISCSQSEDYIRISIRDYGPGFGERDIPNIFDRFYLPEHVKENHTGIGLNLAKLIIEGHQGSVYVYNHHEGGAVFQIILPIYESLKVRD